MNVLVVGTGSIGRRHLGNLLTLQKKLGIKSVSAFDSALGERKRISKEFDIETHDSLKKALALKPDVTFVTTPTGSHILIALQAVRKGSHLFIEKPLGHELAGCRRLLRMLEPRQRLMVGCNLRFHPSVQRIKSLVDRGQIGKIIGARAQSGHYLPDWRPQSDYRKSYSARSEEGGVLSDCIQIFDCLRWLFGSADSIFCFLDKRSRLAIDSEDIAQVQIRFRSGVLAQVHVDYVQRFQEKELHIIGEKGSLIWQWTEKKLRHFDGSSGGWIEYPEPVGFDFNQTFLDELVNFFNSIKNGSEPIQKPEVALELVEWIASSKKSSKSLRAVRLSS